MCYGAGASDYINNGKITKTTKDYISYGLGGAVAGAVAGVGGMALASKATLKTAMAIGGTSSMAGDMTTQFVGKGVINPLQAIKAGVAGALTAGAFYGASKAVGSIKNSPIGKVAKEGGSQVDDLHRPYIRKNVRQQVEVNAPKTVDGKFIDPNTGMVIEGKYDLGHKPGNEFWREKAKAQSEGLTQKQFNDRMNNPDYYQIESPSSNRSHKYEKK